MRRESTPWQPLYDRWRLARVRRRLGPKLKLADTSCPHFWLVDLRLGPDARLEVGAGFCMERQRGNHLWLEGGAELTLGERAWLRTEHGENRITLFAGARISVGADALINGAMLHAKREIAIGRDARLGFGVRVLDADLHDLDSETPERIAPVRIGDRVWLGADVRVLRGVTIGDDVVVGAGSVVLHDLPPRVLAAGAPARPLRSIASREGCR